jgi:hypothetical protein
MDIFDEALIEFWKSLNHYDVKYIMVGGFAVNLHGFSRTTNDIDLWLKDENLNRKNLGKALQQFGYDPLLLERTQFIPGWTDFFIGSGVRLDILTTMVGLENISFEEAFDHASIACIYDINVPFLHINQLIQNKKSTARPKDLVDVQELEKILLLRGNQGKL